MKPAINFEEKIGKTVGKRTPPNPLKIQPNEIENAKAWRRTIPGMRVRPGVYRFRSHEEADAWLMKKLLEAQNSNRATRR